MNIIKGYRIIEHVFYNVKGFALKQGLIQPEALFEYERMLERGQEGLSACPRCLLDVRPPDQPEVFSFQCSVGEGKETNAWRLKLCPIMRIGKSSWQNDMKGMTMKPHLSYTIWFSQRTGSTLLSRALKETGIAGRPDEWMYTTETADFLQFEDTGQGATDLPEKFWQLGSTSNGVCGLKFSLYEPYFSKLIARMRGLSGCPQGASRPDVWEHAFPNSRHIFMTRRNKVRLAVSWWKAIKTGEWKRENGQPPMQVDLADAYSFEAIRHLYQEASMREAGIQEFFAEGGIVPMTVTYDDFILDYEGTVCQVLQFLGLDASSVNSIPPHFERLADDISEEWVQRFRDEMQDGWVNRGW